MHFENAALGCAFDLPDPFTLGDYEKWMKGREEAKNAGAISVFAVNWCGTAPVVCNWQCASLPDPKAPFNSISGEQLKIIAWAGLEAYRYITGLFLLPKG